jgi:hypothetical protein
MSLLRSAAQRHAHLNQCDPLTGRITRQIPGPYPVSQQPAAHVSGTNRGH